MNVVCRSCRAVYRVDPALVPAAGVTAGCSACGAAIPLAATSQAAPDDDWFAEEQLGQDPTRTHRPRQRPAPDDDWFAEEQGAHGRSAWARALEESDAAAAPEIDAPLAPPARRTRDAGTAERHPFLHASPEERAERLARALVSDLIAYHPGRREAARDSGTLRIAFREEIARSYAAYAAQVGRELAEGTRYFHEALNELLAQGRALF